MIKFIASRKFTSNESFLHHKETKRLEKALSINFEGLRKLFAHAGTRGTFASFIYFKQFIEL